MTDQLVIRVTAGQKILVLGQNGTGKSHFVTSIARGHQGSLVVYDPKGDFEAMLPNAHVATSSRDVVAHLPGRVIYRPSLAERTAALPGDPTRGPTAGRPLWTRWDEICRKVLELGRRRQSATMIVEHELADLGGSVSIGPAHGECIRQGRSLGITLILVTQRPQGTPVIARSEAQHVVCFTLTDQDARDVAAGLLADVNWPESERIVRSRALPLDHTWWYRGPDFRLRLCQPLPYSRG